MKLHPLYGVISPVRVDPIKGKFGHCEPVVDATSYGIDDREHVAGRPAPPARNCVVTGELHWRLSTKANHRPKHVLLFVEDWWRWLPLIYLPHRVILERRARLVSLTKRDQAARKENRQSHSRRF